jgi:hypothetical protein
MKRLALIALAVLSVSCGSDEQPVEEPPEPSEQDICESTVRDLPIPFDYEMGSDHLVVKTTGGDLPVLIGPWGAHTQPHTGHAEGNVKSDWAGLFALDRTSPEVNRMSYDGGVTTEGSCPKGSLCGVHQDDIVPRFPDYVFPDDAVRIERVELYDQFGSDPWNMNLFEVEIVLCPYRYKLGHVGAVSTALAEAMVEAGYPDPRTEAVLGENLIEGDAIVLEPATPIARPQIHAKALTESPDYFTGMGSVPDVPWAQIEWTAIHMKDSEDGMARPEFDYMGAEVEAALADVLVAQGLVEDSFRYGFAEPWLWRAEHVLVATEAPFARSGATELTGALGGWWEQPEADVPCEPTHGEECNEVFSIFAIHKEGAFYDPELYSSPDVSYLVYRGTFENGASQIYAFGELISPVTPDPYQGTLLIRWRAVSGDTYQRLAYSGDVETGRLMLRYGEAVETALVSGPDDAPAVTALTGAETCADADIVCLEQEGWGRF